MGTSEENLYWNGIIANYDFENLDSEPFFPLFPHDLTPTRVSLPRRDGFATSCLVLFHPSFVYLKESTSTELKQSTRSSSLLFLALLRFYFR